MRADVESWADQLPGQIEGDESMLASTSSITSVNDLKASWRATAKEIDADIAVLADRAEFYRQTLEQIDALKTTWEASVAALGTDAPAAAAEQARSVLERIEAARNETIDRRDALVTLQAQLASADLSVDELLKHITETLSRLQKGLVSADRPRSGRS